MALSAFGLGFLFSAKDNASPVMRSVERNYTSVDKTATKAARRVQAAQGAMMFGTSALTAGAGGLAISLKSAFAAGEFEQGAAKVGAISSATSEELEQLSSKAIQAGLDTQFSPKQAIGGLGELAVRGLTAAESMQALDGALSLAAGGQISIGEASSTTASALKVFGLEADQAGLAADKLLKISNVTALQAKDLELALGTVGRGAGLAKQSIDEMLPSIGLVKNTGVDASVAASSVSSGLLFMAKNAKKFEKMGVSITDVNGKFRPFMDIVLDTQNAMRGMGSDSERTAKAMELFGRFGVVSFNAIASQTEKGIRTPTGAIVKGAEAVEFLRESMTGAAGTAKKFADALLNTFPGQLTLLKGSIQTLAVVLGEPIAAGLRPVVEMFRSTTNTIISIFQNLSPRMQKVVGVVMIVASGVAALTGAIVVFGGALFLAWPMITAFGAALATAVVPAVLLVGKLGLLAAGVAVVAKAFRANLGGVADFAAGVFDDVKLVVAGFFQLLDDGFFSGDTARKLSQPQNVPILRFFQFIVTFGHRVATFFSGMMTGIESALLSLDPIVSIVVLSFQLLKAAVVSVISIFTGPFTTSVEGARGTGELLGKALVFLSAGFMFMRSRVFLTNGAIIIYRTVLLAARATMILFKGTMMLLRGAVVLGTIAFNAQKRATVLLNAAHAISRLRIMATAGATKLATLASGRFAAAQMAGRLGTLGLVAAVGVGAFKLGQWIDGVTGASDAIADWLANLTGLNNELEKLDALNGGRTETRGGAKFIGDMSAEERKVALQSPGSVVFSNNIAGAAEAQSANQGGGTSAEAVKQGVREALEEVKSQGSGRRPRDIKLQLNGETIAQAVMDTVKDDNASLFGSDFGGDD